MPTLITPISAANGSVRPQAQDSCGGPIARVALDVPMRAIFDYLIPQSLWEAVVPGAVVCVPFGRERRVGIVLERVANSEIAASRLKAIDQMLEGLPPLGAVWRELCEFAAHYYLRGIGEVMLPALPQAVRDVRRWPQWGRRLFTVGYRLRSGAEAELQASLSPRAKLAARLFERLANLSAQQWLDEAELRSMGREAGKPLNTWLERGWIESRRVAARQLPVPDSASPDSADRLEGIDRQDPVPSLTTDQTNVVAGLCAAIAAAQYAPFLLHGVTGSGKTEVYLHAIAAALAAGACAQVLLLVPEINLTPRLQALVSARFPQVPIAVMHSGMAEVERTQHWLAAHSGEARIVLGTRLAILASLSHLRAILVDEEHDPSYKQQEGLRYSARDLAVWRARQLGIPVVLGSATPSLESWLRAQQGHYRLLTLAQRAQPEARLPEVRMIDLGREAQHKRRLIEGLSQPLLAALRERLERGEQSLLYLNRRGYAPVLSCEACGWLSGCPRCSAWLVLHRDSTDFAGAVHARPSVLCCHHCGFESRVPRHCPDCGNVDLQPLGRGTQRIEEVLAAQFPNARVARIDADTTRRKGSAEALFDQVHTGAVDILVGTQMVAKGHDFQRITLVGVVNADGALFSHDFRAAERLFAQLMQVSGRAGRAGLAGEVLIQTRYPAVPLYQALARHDYVAHAMQLLDERRRVLLPPFSYQALVTAEAGKLQAALDFLEKSRERALPLPECADGRVVLHDPVPRAMMRVARRERAQMLIESGSRTALQALLSRWIDTLQTIRPQQQWQLERDPASI